MVDGDVVRMPWRQLIVSGVFQATVMVAAFLLGGMVFPHSPPDSTASAVTSALAVGAMYGVCITLWRRRSESVRLEPSGIAVHRTLRRTQHLSWRDLHGVEIRRTRGGRYVNLLSAPARVRLPAPVDGWGQPNPTFDDDVATIRGWYDHRPR